MRLVTSALSCALAAASPAAADDNRSLMNVGCCWPQIRLCIRTRRSLACAYCIIRSTPPIDGDDACVAWLFTHLPAFSGVMLLKFASSRCWNCAAVVPGVGLLARNVLTLDVVVPG